jgi:hypothetical protein
MAYAHGMRHARSASALLLVFAILLAAPPAPAQRPGARRVTMLRLEGYFGPPPAGRREEADLTVRLGATDRHFQVVKARVLSGDRLAADVLDQIAPRRPNLVLRGPAALLRKLEEAADGQRLTVTGQYRSGGFDLLVGAVD